MAVQVTTKELKKFSKERLREARILLEKNKFHGAKYLGGYALEHALKYCICDHLQWEMYPPSNPINKHRKDAWGGMNKSLMTHDLEILLLFSGEFKNLFTSSALASAWDIAKEWDSELRYVSSPSTVSDEKKATKLMLDSVAKLVRHFTT